MGLAAPKNRFKISQDPQNTHWANNTSRFGHRILEKQGWTPGSQLGAENAAHSSHYTAGSTSHIRVLLKDDTLGLGAKRGSERAENFGLAGLDSVLARLNGRSEEVAKKQEEEREREQRIFVGQRWGWGLNFVSGGYLVGDRIEKVIKTEVVKKEEVVEVKVEDVSEDGADKKKDKKRKRKADEEEAESKITEVDHPKLKRKKKSADLKADSAAELSESTSDKKKSKSKKDKKDKKSKKSKKTTSATSSPLSSPSASLAPVEDDKAARKFEKRRAKEERRKLKEEKRLKKALKKAAKESKESSSSSSDEATSTTAPSLTLTTGTSTSGGFVLGGRHAVRQRYIMQKKRASMDPQALKEIFMIKAPV
ncbi:hypothetical protein GQ43DRAFT_458002 [Delitschia confertaspora ATCC 74209]|uniref:PinX1-related protein 1 n=1 Tax=Delitschia confertaspora ATCC 74209 TaxID=1513339 RepID=A0A9P4JF02_9PLEO|nr:hypothetical protein GQ43DRAFT_458002 [Delitschia confertaspora ATCC 74209]